MKLLKTVDVDTARGTVLVDGVPLGFYLADEPVVATLTKGGLGKVRITLLAEQVTVSADI